VDSRWDAHRHDAVPDAALARQAGADSAKLQPTVKVDADADRPDGMRATTTRAGKTLQHPRDFPQSVTTVTKSIMDEQQAASLRESLRNVSGIGFSAADGGCPGDDRNLRGFHAFADLNLDGTCDSDQYKRGTCNLEQIDVLRDAGAVRFGRGQAGGAIHRVGDVPLHREQSTLTWQRRQSRLS